ncbi:MAG: polyprenyl synthetase family protein [Deltaproteobacteria bacterium]|nr:polyprenyl synthetase family protein [Deltaproteobacteria bacterium]
MKIKLNRIAQAVQDRLKIVFQSVFDIEQKDLFYPVPPLEITTEIEALTLRGGKRLRPALMVAGYELFSDNALNDNALLDSACAMEMLQSYFLIHDDIMDNDPVRRGGPSVHASLQQKTGNRELGIHLGILAGDLACAVCEWLLARLDCTAEKRRRVQEIFSRMHMDVIFGQSLDLIGNAAPDEIVQRKTASYTTIGPLCCGAVLGGASETEVRHMAELARPLGIAFQYRDDLIGVFGDSTVVGKPVGSDVKNNKHTLLMENALKHLDESNATALKHLLEKKNMSESDIASALALIEKSGAKGSSEAHISELFKTVETSLEALTFREDGGAFLLWLSRLLAFREA